MKSKEVKNLRTKSKDGLKKILDKKMSDLMQVKVKLKVAKEKNLKRVKMLRCEISQVKTIIREKELIEQSSEAEKEGEDKI